MKPVRNAVLLTITTATVLAMASPSLAEPDALIGRALALSACAYCHVVSPSQEFGPPLRPQGPDFSTIAEKPEFTAKKLRTFLQTTHRNVARGKAMPNPLLSNAQIDDLVSYILALRKAP